MSALEWLLSAVQGSSEKWIAELVSASLQPIGMCSSGLISEGILLEVPVIIAIMYDKDKQA